MAKCLQKETSTRVRAGLFRRLRSEMRGQELVEFAFLLVLAFPPVLVGIVWVGRAVSVYQALGRAGREGARIALAPTCATCGDTPASDATVDAAINQGLLAAGVDPSKLVSPTPTITRHNLNQDTSDPTNYKAPWVTITLTYPVNWIFFQTNYWTNTKINITSTVSMHQEY